MMTAINSQLLEHEISTRQLVQISAGTMVAR